MPISQNLLRVPMVASLGIMGIAIPNLAAAAPRLIVLLASAATPATPGYRLFDDNQPHVLAAVAGYGNRPLPPRRALPRRQRGARARRWWDRTPSANSGQFEADLRRAEQLSASPPSTSSTCAPSSAKPHVAPVQEIHLRRLHPQLAEGACT